MAKKVLVFFSLSLIFLGTPLTVSAKEAEIQAAEEPVPVGYEPEVSEEDGKVNLITGFSSAVVPLVFIGSWNRFVSRASWAKVKWEDVNHYRKLEFDDDWYWTNFVLHPYQGALAYMGARNSNFGTLGSFGISVLSSTIWEFFCEKNAPSINDMVYTTVGAFAVGEMLYRLSIDGSDLWKPLGYVLNPMRLYTDFTTGHKPNGPHNNIYKLSLRSYMNAMYGVTYPKEGNDNLEELYPGLLGIETNVEYRDPYGHDSNSPYSSFELTFGGGVGAPSGKGYREIEKKVAYDIHIFSNGMILSRSIPEEINTDTTWGLVMDYDFMLNSFCDFSSLAPGFAFKQRRHFDHSYIEYQAHLDFLLLGTTDMFYTRRQDYYPLLVSDEDRSYSYTMGAEAVGTFKWFWENGDMLSFALHSYFMFDLPDPDKDHETKGFEWVNHFNAGYEVPLTNSVAIGFENVLYYKKSLYSNYPDMDAFSYTAGMYAKYKFKD